MIPFTTRIDGWYTTVLLLATLAKHGYKARLHSKVYKGWFFIDIVTKAKRGLHPAVRDWLSNVLPEASMWKKELEELPGSYVYQNLKGVVDAANEVG
jgi:hypothetical protein